MCICVYVCVLTALQQTKNKGNAQREICIPYMNVHMYIVPIFVCILCMLCTYICTYIQMYNCTHIHEFSISAFRFQRQCAFSANQAELRVRLRTKTRLGPSRKERQRERDRVSLRARERHKERGRVAGWCTHFARVQCVIITQHTHVSCCCCGCVDPHFPFKHLSSVSLCCFVSFGKQKAHAKHAHA